jgi:transcriptional regulator with GAF, ATPase, and Fis domain
MIISEEINAAYYAMCIIKDKIDISNVKTDVKNEERLSEFTIRERKRALEIIEEVQLVERCSVYELNESKVHDYLLILSEKVQALAKQELTAQGYDIREAREILDKIRQDSSEKIAIQHPPLSLNFIPTDIAPLLLQLLNASGESERLLRELVFVVKKSMPAEGVAVFSIDDRGQLYMQHGVDMAKLEGEHATRAVEEYLATKVELSKHDDAITKDAACNLLADQSEDYCCALAPRRGGGEFVLYLHTSVPLTDRHLEILNDLIKFVRLSMQMIDLHSDVRRTQQLSANALPSASSLSPNIITAGVAMHDVLVRMERMKDSDATVLLIGESGTGKGVIARALHEESSRRDKVFLPYNCTAAPRELVESQLFGHRRGTFTGAVDDQRGIIRAAEGGTLFLDEIGDLSLEVQPKLLRFLQGGEIMPLGEAPQKVNVRVIAATNRDLEQDVREGRFREDLFYRLNIFVIKVPPLRERPEDIPLLANYYLEEACRRNNRQLAGITPEAMNYLVRYQWPGNVRQLRSEIERIVVFAEDGQSVGAESLSSDILHAAATQSPVRFHLDFSKAIDFKEIMQDVERQLLTEALARYSGNIRRAAESLGLSRQALSYKLRYLDISPLEIGETIGTEGIIE